ncbi:L,D-transpeptidase family protein [Sphingomicrobium nitratireducens]|uniref:L,D-transpeptidase family protein n=1 Tax=Sphingomicrobium nitratireducens TaxID=2964666 RepID=UPI00223EA78B
MKKRISKTLLATAGLILPAGAVFAAPQAAVPAPQAQADAHVAPGQAPPDEKVKRGAVVGVEGSPDAQGNETPVVAVDPGPPMWQVHQAEALLSFIEAIGAEGLAPADYDPAGLRATLAAGNPLELAKAATDRFYRVASDMALGHARGDARRDWHIVDHDLDVAAQRPLLVQALAANDIAGTLASLAPTHPQYAALKHALASTDKADAATLDKIRLNLDRWRWLPRDLGNRYIIVNVPAYTAALVEDGETRSRHRAVAGAVKTPTPQLMAEATGVIWNPYWNVPKSIEPEVRGKAGYEAVKNDDGTVLYWRQPPGPSNALGRVKFVMTNPHLIYLHDTNARGLFDTKARAYSHGCIRTENILKLATMLLEEDGGDWTTDKTVEVVNSGERLQANFVKPLPVYIVYMSAAAKPDGTIVEYKDIYSRDKPVLAALDDKAGTMTRAEASEERLADIAEAIEGGL